MSIWTVAGIAAAVLCVLVPVIWVAASKSGENKERARARKANQDSTAWR